MDVAARASTRKIAYPPSFAIVRRGETETFRMLKEQLEEPEVVDVIWDRRSGERRVPAAGHEPDRRHLDRRGPPPEMWATFGFVVAPQLGRLAGR
jgi:hypothetical protein